MTILFFCRFFYPDIGGVEKHAFEVAKRLAKKHKVTIITESAKKDCKEKIHGITIQRLYFGKHGWFKKFKIWKSLWRKRSLIEKADVVHAHDVFFWYLPFRFLYPRKRVYTTFHGFETRFPPSKKAVMVRKLSEELSLGNIIVGDYIKKWYGTKPDFVTYGAAKEIKNEKLKIKNCNSKLKILFIGRLEEDTGIPIYLKTLEILKKKGIKFEFEALGDGSFRGDAERFGKVHGFVKNISDYLKKADIVFSSSYLSIIEGLSHRKLVFSVYNNPLKKDYLKMAPFSKLIIIEGSPYILASKIEYFSKNPDNKTEPAYNWVKQQTWDKVVDLYIKLWGI